MGKAAAKKAAQKAEPEHENLAVFFFLRGVPAGTARGHAGRPRTGRGFGSPIGVPSTMRI